MSAYCNKRFHAPHVSLLQQTLPRSASQLIATNASTLCESAYCNKRLHAPHVSLLQQTLPCSACQLIVIKRSAKHSCKFTTLQKYADRECMRLEKSTQTSGYSPLAAKHFILFRIQLDDQHFINRNIDHFSCRQFFDCPFHSFLVYVHPLRNKSA